MASSSCCQLCGLSENSRNLGPLMETMHGPVHLPCLERRNPGMRKPPPCAPPSTDQRAYSNAALDTSIGLQYAPGQFDQTHVTSGEPAQYLNTASHIPTGNAPLAMATGNAPLAMATGNAPPAMAYPERNHQQLPQAGSLSGLAITERVPPQRKARADLPAQQCDLQSLKAAHVALEHCTVHSQKGQSILVTCQLCNWGGEEGTPVSLHILLYGHYLKQPHVSTVRCLADHEIQAKQPVFWTKLQDRLRSFMHKRRLRIAKGAVIMGPSEELGANEEIAEGRPRNKRMRANAPSARDPTQLLRPQVWPSQIPFSRNGFEKSAQRAEVARGGSLQSTLPVVPHPPSRGTEQQNVLSLEANLAWGQFFLIHGLDPALCQTPFFMEAIAATLKCGSSRVR